MKVICAIGALTQFINNPNNQSNFRINCRLFFPAGMTVKEVLEVLFWPMSFVINDFEDADGNIVGLIAHISVKPDHARPMVRLMARTGAGIIVSD